MDIYAVNNDICDELDGDASTIGNVYIDTTAINCLKAVHNKLLLECDHHVSLEHNPQRPVLNDSVP